MDVKLTYAFYRSYTGEIILYDRRIGVSNIVSGNGRSMFSVR